MPNSSPIERLPLLLALTCVALLVASGLHPFDRGTWVLEVVPIFVALPLLAFTYKGFTFTRMVYVLIFLHACILMVGGHYTYAKVPLGVWMQEWFGFARNHYDRIGHLAQGFVPAMVAREILLRKTPLRPGGWLFTLITATCLAISAIYELAEWGAAVALGAGADEFLATQGDPWDTQKDMLMAWLGAMAGQLLLARWHDRQLAALAKTN